MFQQMTEAQLNARLDFVEAQIAKTTDWKQLPALNNLFQQIIEELARRDVAAEQGK